MNSFLYLDEYKMYSISAQIFRGHTESVVEFSSKQQHIQKLKKVRLVVEKYLRT